MAIVDSQLRGDDEYDAMGPNSVDRVKTLLGKLHSTMMSTNRGSRVSEERKLLFNNFVKQVQRIFDNLPKPLEWQSFYIHDLNLLVQADQAVRKVSIQNKLTKSQTWSLVKLNDVCRHNPKSEMPNSCCAYRQH